MDRWSTSASGLGVYEEIEQEGSGVAASDRAAIFVDINL